MLINEISIERSNFYEDLSNEEAERLSGGEAADTVNRISRGRAIVTVNLRPFLVDGQGFNGEYGSCAADFNDFTGDLTIDCTGLPGAENPDQVIQRA